MIIPKRKVQKFEDLHPDELDDIFTSAHMMSPILQEKFEATSMMLAVQVQSSLLFSSIQGWQRCWTNGSPLPLASHSKKNR